MLRPRGRRRIAAAAVDLGFRGRSGCSAWRGDTLGFLDLRRVAASADGERKANSKAQRNNPFHDGISKESSDLTAGGPSASGTR